MELPMTTDQQKTLVLALRDLMADLYGLYFQAHTAHWNVEGPFFGPLHTFFGTIYEEVFASIDLVAEGIRFQQVYAPMSLLPLIQSMRVEAPTFKNGSATEMLSSLLVANDVTLQSLKTAFRAATDAGDDGLANKLQDLMFVHQKYDWQIRSHVKTLEPSLI